MALVIPTGRSTFGDATKVPGGPLSAYVLAQLPEDADLGWLPDIRRMAVVDELKWKIFQSRRERLQSKADLWNRIRGAMRSATIVIIKPSTIEQTIRQMWLSQGAEEGIDFTQGRLIDDCATAIVADTPVAYLPNHLSEALRLYPEHLYLSFERFAPAEIKRKIGGTLRDAKVFAARAHATFSTENAQVGDHTIDAFRHPGATLILRELLATHRTFDVEHPASATVLNEAAEAIAAVLQDVLLAPGELSTEPLVREYDSRAVDHLQGADIAAGWAHELVALGNERVLAETFGRVIINGRVANA